MLYLLKPILKLYFSKTWLILISSILNIALGQGGGWRAAVTYRIQGFPGTDLNLQRVDTYGVFVES